MHLWIFMDIFMGMIKMPDIKLNQNLLSTIAEIDQFNGSWQVLQALEPDQLSTLKTVATIESIASSTRIEGVKLSDAQVQVLLSRVGLEQFRTRDEQEVAGYAEAINLVFQSYEFIALSENNIKQIHATLLKHSIKDDFHRGEYKKQSNSVKTFDANGAVIGVIFETAEPFDTPRFMSELLEWTNKNLLSRQQHPLLVVATFALVFLAIHPFLDGNGRLSRILTTLLLLKSGYSYLPYSSLERIIEQNKDNYYLSLRSSQKGIFNGTADSTSWVDFFTKCLKAQKDSLSSKIDNFRLMQPLPQLSLEIIKIIKSHGRTTTKELVLLTAANRNTIKLHLKNLVAANRLKAHGVGKGTFYTLL